MLLSDAHITELRELASIAISTSRYLEEVCDKLDLVDAAGSGRDRLQRRLDDAANAHERAHARYAEAAEEYLTPGVVLSLLTQAHRGRRSDDVLKGWSSP